MKIEDSYGRLLTESQMTNDLKKIALELPAIEKQNGRYQCFRCGSLIDQKLWKLREVKVPFQFSTSCPSKSCCAIA